jgi:hypothetical protein
MCKYRVWGKKSAKLLAKKSGKYYERTNIMGVLREGFGQQIFEKAYQRRFINFNMMWRFLELSQILGVIT